jgi:hypothetical protein
MTSESGVGHEWQMQKELVCMHSLAKLQCLLTYLHGSGKTMQQVTICWELLSRSFASVASVSNHSILRNKEGHSPHPTPPHPTQQRCNDSMTAAADPVT